MDKMAWNLESEYPSHESPEFSNEFDLVKSQVKMIGTEIEALAGSYEGKTSQIQKILITAESTEILLWNLSSYLRFHLSVDSSLNVVQGLASEVGQTFSSLTQIMVPVVNFVKTCSDEEMLKILDHPGLKQSGFHWGEQRKLKDQLMTDKEESLLEALSNPGKKAWGDLYNAISGSMKCILKYEDRTEEMGLAQASALVRGENEETRKVAWTAIQNSWSQNRDAAAAILNALAGWRHEENTKRSLVRPVNYLDSSLHQNRISVETLNAMMEACHQNVEQSRKAPVVMAQLIGKKSLDPWDILAQSPISSSKNLKTFDQGIEMIRDAFGKGSSEMSGFVDMMVAKRWIEARVLPNKRNGAFCSGFPKSVEPRVFMTYMGTNHDVSTLAHELGHAYHSWVMRDLPVSQKRYPMTLAETASIFSETLLHDVLFEKAQTLEEKIEFSWGEVEAASSFLLNIPARYDFEKSFYEQRKKRTLSPDELMQLTDEAWTKWYGTTLTSNDKMFWASKLHFSMSGVSFYNYPYTFGYLFSMSIYARKNELGDGFIKTYVDILRDTGRMTAEDLVQKHLGEDIRTVEFWKKSIQVVNDKITNFEKLVSDYKNK